MNPTHRIAVGRDRHGRVVEPPAGHVLRHALVTGTTGWGKSGFLHSILLDLIRKGDVAVCVLDGKGQTADELVEAFLPALSLSLPHVRPENVVTVAPFSRYGVPLNPLHPLRGLGRAVQAQLVCDQIAALSGHEFGPRMVGVLSWAARAAMEIEGSLVDCLRILTDAEYRRAVAERLEDAEVRHYFERVFDDEPNAAIQSVRARLERLLAHDELRAHLCARGCIQGDDLLRGPITVVNLAGAPFGSIQYGRLMGSFVFMLLAAAIFDRPPGGTYRPTLIVIDEWQEIARTSAAELERILAQARSRGISLWLANQTLGQVESAGRELLSSLQSNVSLHLAFRPERSEIAHLQDLLPRTHLVDHTRPDQVLSREAELTYRKNRLLALPPRHGLLVDRTAGTAEEISTLDVPFVEARERAERVAPDIREAFRRGRLGVPMDDLLRGIGRLAIDLPPDTGDRDDPPPRDDPRRPPRERRSSRRRGATIDPDLLRDMADDP